VAGPASPAADDVDLLTVLEHELGHVLGLPDNNQAGDLMDITLGLGVRRSPTAADLSTIAGASATAVPTDPPQPSPVIGSVSGATVDAALASIVGVGNGDAGGSAVKPGTPAASMGPVPGAGVPPRKKEQGAHASRPYPHRIDALPFPRKARGIGQSSVLDPRTSARARGDSE
jgi:hypothetical protein